MVLGFVRLYSIATCIGPRTAAGTLGQFTASHSNREVWTTNPKKYAKVIWNEGIAFAQIDDLHAKYGDVSLSRLITASRTPKKTTRSKACADVDVTRASGWLQVLRKNGRQISPKSFQVGIGVDWKSHLKMSSFTSLGVSIHGGSPKWRLYTGKIY